MKDFPDQPLYDEGTKKHGIRFQPNAIVKHLLYHSGMNMHQLAGLGFDKGDVAQLAQLLGYSLDGYGEQSYIPDELYERAAKKAEEAGFRLVPDDADSLPLPPKPEEPVKRYTLIFDCRNCGCTFTEDWKHSGPKKALMTAFLDYLEDRATAVHECASGSIGVGYPRRLEEVPD